MRSRRQSSKRKEARDRDREAEREPRERERREVKGEAKDSEVRGFDTKENDSKEMIESDREVREGNGKCSVGHTGRSRPIFVAAAENVTPLDCCEETSLNRS